jgi:hypothetical protein
VPQKDDAAISEVEAAIEVSHDAQAIALTCRVPPLRPNALRQGAIPIPAPGSAISLQIQT